MKNLLILLSLVVILSSCHGHRSNKGKECKGKEESKEIIVPTAVKTAFAKQFATAKDAEWSLEKAGEYEAEFMLDKKEMEALFDTNGILINTETPVKESELPQAIRDSLAKGFAGNMLGEIGKVDTKGVITYEMEVKTTSDITFDPNGKLVKKEVKKEEEEKKGEKSEGKKENKKEKD